jgi:hypothetical protein
VRAVWIPEISKIRKIGDSVYISITKLEKRKKPGSRNFPEH